MPTARPAPAARPTGRAAVPDEVLYIGIDLGTSRSAVVASNGRRDWVHSFVAWPRDFVARKMLGRDVLFGEEAVKNRRSVELVRPLENGVIREGTARDEEAVRQLIHYLIEMARPEEGRRIHAAVGVPAEALRTNKLAIRDAVREYADALMVVSEPFAVAYGQGTLNNAVVIDIGAGTTDFCVMHGTMPGEEDQATLTLAGDYVDRQLYNILSEQYPQARLSEPIVREYKERYGFVGQPKNRVQVKVAMNGRFEEIDITDALRHACESIVAPISETLLDIISQYESDFQEIIRNNIIIAGGGSQIRGIAEAIEEELSDYGRFSIKAIDDPLYAGAGGALALTEDMPAEYWEDM